jgi:hypothetical protein
MSALASQREVGAGKMYAFAFSTLALLHASYMLYVPRRYLHQVGIFAMIDQVGVPASFQDQDHPPLLFKVQLPTRRDLPPPFNRLEISPLQVRMDATGLKLWLCRKTRR